MSIDWGSVPDWLAGVGAVLALIFAGLAARAASRTNRMQAEQIAQLEADKRDREEQQRAAQASSIAVWVSVESGDNDAAVVRYVNSSALPVYDVLLCIHTPIGAAEKPYPVLGPLSGRRALRGASTVLRRYLGRLPFAQLRDEGRIVVAFSFRDAAGRWWCRTAEGELHLVGSRADAEAIARRPTPA